MEFAGCNFDFSQGGGFSIIAPPPPPSALVYFIETLTNSSGSSINNAICYDTLGNLYTIGYSPVSGGATQKALIVKYDSSGTVQWQRILGSASNEYGKGIAVDTSGNVYICGISTDTSGFSYGFAAKYNSSGTLQWQKRYGVTTGTYQTYFNSITIDSSGNSYVTGNSNNHPTTATGYTVIVKYDTSGTLQWQRSLDGSASDTANAIGIDSSNNVYVGLYSNGISGSDYYNVVVKYNSSGTLQWQRSLGSSGINSFIYGIAVDTSGNSHLIYSYGPNGTDMGIAKYNTSGTLQWQRSFGGAGYEPGNGIAVDGSGNVYGIGYSGAIGSNDFIIVKYDISGTLQWQRNLGVNTKTDVGYAIAVDSSSQSYAVTGYANNGTDPTVLIAKFPTDGTKTGTYTVGSDSFVYATTSLTSSTTTMTSAASSLTDATPSLADATSSLTSTASSLTAAIAVL